MRANELEAKSLILRKLRAGRPFSADEVAALDSLPVQEVEFRAGQDVMSEGDRPMRSFALLEGFACSFKTAKTGKRQIVSFEVPGDIPDLQSLHIDRYDVSMSTLTPCRIGFIQHDAIHAVCERFPGITAALWRETLVRSAIFREWVNNIGQRSAPSRIAHLLCELFVRLHAVGLVEANSCPMPLTQADIGDAMGVSYVHVNRSLQDLRGDGLIRLAGKRLDILDWRRLKHVADFNPAYLQMGDWAKSLSPGVVAT